MVTPSSPSALAAWRLAAALIVDMCARVGVAVIVIKGPVAAAQGLRGPRIPGDLDVLVEPSGAERVVRALEAQGWRIRAVDDDDVTFPAHAVTVFRRGWPIDIDVHHRYKGLELDPASAFAALEAMTELHRAGSATFRVPTAHAHAILLALHALRTPGLPARQRELHALMQAMRGMEPAALLDVATRLGALATARPVLERLEVPVRGDEWGVPQTEWRMLTELRDGNERRAALLRELTWCGRVGVVRDWMRPSVDVLYKNRDLDHRTRLKSVFLYLRRLARGLVLLPAALVRTSHLGPRIMRSR